VAILTFVKPCFLFDFLKADILKWPDRVSFLREVVYNVLSDKQEEMVNIFNMLPHRSFSMNYFGSA
jgi:hypothetical protein